MVSVAGLAPVRVGLKGRTLDLLCIHGRMKWSLRLVSHQRLLGFSEALICLSYSGKGARRFRRNVMVAVIGLRHAA